VREAYDKDEKIEREALELCAVLIGLCAANDFSAKPASSLLAKSRKDNAEYTADCFEVARRFKILNPDKLRDTYGKLLFVLMDSARPSTRRALGFSLTRRVKTVSTHLKSVDQANMLSDGAMADATSEIVQGHSPEDAQKKARAVQFLVDRYATPVFPPEEVRRVLSSIEDALSFLRSNRDPVDQMLGYLHRFFSADEPADRELSLDLRGRNTRPRHELDHDHKTQFTFVLQSLELWREVMSHFFKLWFGAEDDLLDERNGYSLANTGQGMNRCQNAPRTRANMQEILSTVRQRHGHWAGLQVVHLGDREVPNALVFIDKYTQVPRIFNPVVRCLQAVEGELAANAHTRAYLDQHFGGPERCIQLILADLFRGGLDGGGDLGGSCIDGRLTSLWNWSSLLEKKPYYPVFLLSGFLSFDGDFGS
jgi:hypothetical protein